MIDLLKKLAEGEPRTAVLLTIHQPSFRVFAMFSKIYMLTNQTGKCIYEGQPDKIIEHVARYKIVCPDFHNPSDFLMEVASGDHGSQVIHQLSSEQEGRFKGASNNWSQLPQESLKKV